MFEHTDVWNKYYNFMPNDVKNINVLNITLYACLTDEYNEENSLFNTMYIVCLLCYYANI